MQGPLSTTVWKTVLPSVCAALCLALTTGGVWGQPADDHGDTFAAATDLPLGSSIAGRTGHGDDRDVFRLDLTGRSGSTDVWVYATGELDSVAWLYDSGENLLAFNDDGFIGTQRSGFHIRWVLPRGVYYLAVRGFRDEDTGLREIGDYVVHAAVATDPGSTVETATRLAVDTLAPGKIDSNRAADYFRIDLSETTNLTVDAINLFLVYPVGPEEFDILPVSPLAVEVLDSDGAEMSVNIYETIARIDGEPHPAGFFIRDDFEPGAYYFKVTTPPGVASHPVPYTFGVFEDTEYTELVERCEARTRSLGNPEISDPLYACQWHLERLGGGDVNVESAWAQGATGEGVNVAVVDDGMYFTHEDLKDNVDTSRNHDYTGSGSIYIPLEHHGTHVTGIIAARDNDVGVRGVAPRATVYGYNYLAAETTTLNRADAMSRHRADTAVSSNSWGPIDGPGVTPSESFWEQAVDASLRSGYGGKGVFYAFAGGNGHEMGDDSNLDGLANYYGVTAVCAVNDHDTRSGFSEMGANLWVCAPSNDLSDLHQGILTTENNDRYFEEFGGTSASTPIVAGVAALMRDVNPDLTWRDLKLILAGTARKNDAANPGWQEGARQYGSASDAHRYHFNREYGFGVVDAGAAVRFARGWITAPPLQTAAVTSGQLDVAIPDAPLDGAPTTVTRTLALESGVEFTEFVEVTASFRHTSFRDLEIELISPSGTVSRLVGSFDALSNDFDLVVLNGDYRFGSARHLGEDPNGTWQLRITDRIPSVGGVLRSWSVRVYGHSGTPTIPGPLLEACGDAVTDKSNTALVADCDTLLAARDVLAPPRVGREPRLNWSAGTPIAEWDGVLEDSLEGSPQRVTRLYLSGMGLDGSIPSELTGLTELKELYLHDNELSGPIPPELGDLSSLTHLHAYRNDLGGELPSELGKLSALRELRLESNDLSGLLPPELGSLTRLTRLFLADNDLSGTIPPELGGMTSLDWLNLGRNNIGGEIPAELGDLSRLRRLYIYENDLAGPIPSSIGSLSRLTHIVAQSNDLSGTLPPELGGLSSLVWLGLHDNDLSGRIPGELGDLEKLQRLYLTNNELYGEVPEELGKLSALTDLFLSSNYLEGQIPASLDDLENLRRLRLAGNAFTGCLPAGLANVRSSDADSLGLPTCPDS